MKTVQCPADRGQSAYTGQIVSIGTHLDTNIQGIQFLWVSVKHPDGTVAVWPSHRIGLKIWSPKEALSLNKVQEGTLVIYDENKVSKITEVTISGYCLADGNYIKHSQINYVIK